MYVHLRDLEVESWPLRPTAGAAATVALDADHTEVHCEGVVVVFRDSNIGLLLAYTPIPDPQLGSADALGHPGQRRPSGATQGCSEGILTNTRSFDEAS